MLIYLGGLDVSLKGVFIAIDKNNKPLTTVLIDYKTFLGILFRSTLYACTVVSYSSGDEEMVLHFAYLPCQQGK